MLAIKHLHCNYDDCGIVGYYYDDNPEAGEPAKPELFIGVNGETYKSGDIPMIKCPKCYNDVIGVNNMMLDRTVLPTSKPESTIQGRVFTTQ